ncbi:MAG TPA: ribose-5-phosphate isomerase RpiA [Gemmataceae bacterium]|nr:ribose-5-phosphate isomerase RpiA [Gemmataceae bacterium]
MTIYERALEFVADGSAIGVGSGRASAEFIKLLGARVAAGLRVRCVPTSRKSADLAASLGIPLISLDQGMPLSLTVDGADEVDPHMNLIKGYGRALVREKIVAAASQTLVILVGPGKTTDVLGARGKLPVEVVPFALPLCQARLRQLGLRPVPFEADGKVFLSDNGNAILDCGVDPIADPAGLESKIRAIPGVVGTGLFLDMADVVLIGDDQFEATGEKRRGSAAMAALMTLTKGA